MTTPADAAQAEVSTLLLKVEELDQENLRLKARLQPLVRLEMAAREALTEMDGV